MNLVRPLIRRPCTPPTPGQGERKRNESNAQGREARPGSSRVPSPVGLRFHERRAGDSNSGTAHRGLHAFRACSSSIRALSNAEGERIERPWDSRPNLRLATGCLTTRPAFLTCPTADSNREPLRSEGSASTSWARRAGAGPARHPAMPVAARLRNLVTDPTQSGYRESDPGLHHGKVMRYHYAPSAWSPRSESDRSDLSRNQGSALPLS